MLLSILTPSLPWPGPCVSTRKLLEVRKKQHSKAQFGSAKGQKFPSWAALQKPWAWRSKPRIGNLELEETIEVTLLLGNQAQYIHQGKCYKRPKTISQKIKSPGWQDCSTRSLRDPATFHLISLHTSGCCFHQHSQIWVLEHPYSSLWEWGKQEALEKQLPCK